MKTEPTATETKNQTVFFIGKNEYWHRFEIVGPDLVKVESFWLDDIQKTNTYSKIGARRIWKMLIAEGYAGKDPEHFAGNFVEVRVLAIDKNFAVARDMGGAAFFDFRIKVGEAGLFGVG